MLGLPEIRGLRKIMSLLNIQTGNSRQQAVSLTVGFYLALFPVLGFTTLLGFVVSIIFKLNHLIIQGLNFALSPLQFLLIYPFMNFGSWLFLNRQFDVQMFFIRNGLFTFDYDSIYKVIKILAGGVVVWSVVFITTGPILCLSLIIVLNRRNRLKI